MGYKDVKVGDPVYVWKEVRPYRVKCRDERFIICTKPYNPKHTVMYLRKESEDRTIWFSVPVTKHRNNVKNG